MVTPRFIHLCIGRPVTTGGIRRAVRHTSSSPRLLKKRARPRFRSPSSEVWTSGQLLNCNWANSVSGDRQHECVHAGVKAACVAKTQPQNTNTPNCRHDVRILYFKSPPCNFFLSAEQHQQAPDNRHVRIHGEMRLTYLLCANRSYRYIRIWLGLGLGAK